MSNHPTVIISNEADAHIPYVARHLHNEPVIIDPQAVINGNELSYFFSNKQLRVSYRGADVTDVRGIWLRKPANPELWAMPVATQYKKYAQSALLETFNALYTAFPQATWISDYYAVARADNKPFQQTLATSLGFRTPETLYTSDPLKAQQFMQKHKDIVVKSLAAHHPKDENGHVLAFFTRKVRRGENINLDGLHVAPGVFQSCIEVGHEVRVTVVKDKVFAARIHVNGQTTKNVRDWRLGHFEGEIDFEPYQLDTSIKRKCVSLVARLGLNFGAIDLIYDTKGAVWFLEINANGQWAFIEKSTHQPIGKAIALCLEGTTIS